MIKVKTGTIRIRKTSEISNEFVNPNSAKFLSILEEFYFVLAKLSHVKYY